MAKIQVLVVDDEPKYLKLLRYNLEAVGYEVITAANGEDAILLVAREKPDLVILDIRLPGMDGYEVCTKIHEFSNVPLIMLTAKGLEEEKVRGLRLGADDYITKPFGSYELTARVEAALRRSLSNEVKTIPVIEIGDLYINLSQRKVAVKGQEIHLSPTEYRLLHHLATNAGRLIVHGDLLEQVWGPEYHESYEGLRVYIRRLRKKIEPDPKHPVYVITQLGVGYMLQYPH